MANVRIKRIVSWTIPYFGNVHCQPYGILEVTDGTTTKCCHTKGDKETDEVGYQYITFNRKRYEVVNEGRLHFPALRLRLVN